MSLQSNEGTYAHSIANRLSSAVPYRMVDVSAPQTFDDESVLYIDTAATVVFTPAGQGTTVSVSFPAGWIPVRAIAVTSCSAGNIYRAY